jgi:hypothetical protein
MAQATNRFADDNRYEVCMKAARAGAELRKDLQRCHELAGTLPVTELERQLQGIMDAAGEAFRTCSRRQIEPDCTCAATLCPMASSGMAMAGVAMAVAMLQLQGSALKLHRVAHA